MRAGFLDEQCAYFGVSLEFVDLQLLPGLLDFEGSLVRLPILHFDSEALA